MESWFKALLPSSFPVGNTHRVVLFQAPQPEPEFTRLEERLADGIAALREAVRLHRQLETPHHNATHRELRALRDRLESPRLVSEKTRLLIQDALEAAQKAERDHGPTATLEAMRAALQITLDAAQRVADLLSAERDIGWHRGIRS